jgi:hypothetical protein
MREKNNTNNATVIRVHKRKNYTVMCNKHLFQRDLSLKAKGLMSVFLALPDDWNYSISGLCKFGKEGKDAINSTIAELKKFGYVEIERKNAEKGRFTFIYHIYEEGKKQDGDEEIDVSPCTDFPYTDEAYTENPTTVVPSAVEPNSVNPQQLNTNESIIKKPNTKKPKEEKNSFGEFKNVFLTQTEVDKLKTLYKNETKFNEGIEVLSSYKESSGKKYKSDYAVLNKSNWVFKKVFPNVEQLQIVSSGGGKYSRCYG